VRPCAFPGTFASKYISRYINVDNSIRRHRRQTL
jgi:hypothetical protein